MYIRAALIAGIAMAHASAFAADETTPAKLLDDFKAEAGAGTPLSAERGRQLVRP